MSAQYSRTPSLPKLPAEPEQMRARALWTAATLLTCLLSAAGGCAAAHHPRGAAQGAGAAANQDAGLTFTLPDAAAMPLSSPCAPGATREVASDCADGRSCLAVCIGGDVRTWCVPCDQPLAQCPSDPPQQDAPCAQPSSPCTYARCDSVGVVESTCSGGHWQLRAQACRGPRCQFGEDGFGTCGIDEACGRGESFAGLCPDALSSECTASPCLGKPFSCECAAELCGPYHLCSAANAGEVTCVPNPALSGLPQAVPGPDSDFVVAAGWLCSSAECVDPNGAARHALAAGLGWLGLVEHAGYLYGADGGKLTRVALSGGPLEQVLDFSPGSFDFDSDTLYFTRRNASASAAEIMAAALDGSAQRSLFAAQAGVGALRVYAGNLYWETSDGVMQQALSGGAPRKLIAPVPALGIGVFAGGALYWFDQRSRQLQSLELASAQLSAFPDITGQTLASDADALYFTAPARRSFAELVRVPVRAFSERSVLATVAGSVALQVDAGYVYWRACGGTFRIAK
jgi:hypothetical protein